MNERIDVLAVMDAIGGWAREVSDQFIDSEDGMRSEYAQDMRNYRAARAAVAELIERDKAAQAIFDCILRGVNDTSGEMGNRSLQYVPSWLESWAKSLIAAGFKPSNPEAGDIKRALARVGGDA